MKLLLFFTIISLISLNVSAVKWIEAYDPTLDDGYNYCYSSHDNVAPMESGETRQLPGTCMKATCNSDRNIAYEGCGVSKAEPPCYVTEDRSLPHPHCCPKIKCPDN